MQHYFFSVAINSELRYDVHILDYFDLSLPVHKNSIHLCDELTSREPVVKCKWRLR